jgi:hypothetical protein
VGYIGGSFAHFLGEVEAWSKKQQACHDDDYECSPLLPELRITFEGRVVVVADMPGGADDDDSGDWEPAR